MFFYLIIAVFFFSIPLYAFVIMMRSFGGKTEIMDRKKTGLTKEGGGSVFFFCDNLFDSYRLFP